MNSFIFDVTELQGMKIAILGTRGIPNNHGGFEQFAEYLSQYLIIKGHKVYVYSSHSHPFQKATWKGISILHKYDPEQRIGTFGQFIYDFNCIVDSRRRDFDIILQLGYTSSSIWGWLLPKNAVVITNMDGLEWLRAKYSPMVRRFLKFAEWMAIKTSNYLIADSIGIQEYLRSNYSSKSYYIPYGAELFSAPSELILNKYQIVPFNYSLLIARLEPENNIEVILQGFVASRSSSELLIVGKHNTSYGRYLKRKFEKYNNIQFLGGIYDINHLNNLRYFSNLYFHGHSAGGTNPSLLEAMASNALIVAHDNIFNRSILGGDAFYFTKPEEVANHFSKKKEDYYHLIENNRRKIEKYFQWEAINKSYESFMIECTGA